MARTQCVVGSTARLHARDASDCKVNCGTLREDTYASGTDLSRRVHSGSAQRRAHDHRGGHVDHGLRRARRAGPTNDPVMLTSFADYERRFGGLDVASPMSYAVRDFYLNGGSIGADRAGAARRRRAATITLDRRRQPGGRPGAGGVQRRRLGQSAQRRGRPRHRSRAAAHVAAGGRSAALQPHGALPRPPRPRRVRDRELRLGVHRRGRPALPAAGARARVRLRARARRDARVRPALERRRQRLATHRDLDRCRPELGLGRQRHRRQRHHRRAGSEDRHLCAEPRRSLQPAVHPAARATPARCRRATRRHPPPSTRRRWPCASSGARC